jgi:hypothetical protein
MATAGDFKNVERLEKNWSEGKRNYINQALHLQRSNGIKTIHTNNIIEYILGSVLIISLLIGAPLISSYASLDKSEKEKQSKRMQVGNDIISNASDLQSKSLQLYFGIGFLVLAGLCALLARLLQKMYGK